MEGLFAAMCANGQVTKPASCGQTTYAGRGKDLEWSRDGGRKNQNGTGLVPDGEGQVSLVRVRRTERADGTAARGTGAGGRICARDCAHRGAARAARGEDS